jgi:nitronate monooxygenase
MLKTFGDTALCKLLGCELPIILAGMGGVSRSELVAAVNAAGGFGFLGMVREPSALIEREVLAVRALGHHQFGVNIIPAATPKEQLDQQLETILRLHVPVVALFWDIDERIVARLRDAGIVVVYQVGSVEEAIAAERAGAQIIIAQGVEAGGHVRGTLHLRDLLPQVVGAVKVPVVAAGGLATGGDLVTALALGAEGIALGTALMASQESFAHDYHKQRLTEASADQTLLTTSFHINWPPGAAVRVLKSPVVDHEQPLHSRVVIGDEDGRPIYLFSTDSPLRSMTGDFASMALYAGTGVGRIDTIPTAATRIATIMAEASRLIEGTPVAVASAQSSSSVCYASEFSGDYMGHASDAEIGENLRILAADLAEALHLALAYETDDAPASAPPFPDPAYDYAAWTLNLRDLTKAAGFAPPPHPSTGVELAGKRLSLLHRLEALLPRLPETPLRGKLSALADFLRAEQARSFIQK